MHTKHLYTLILAIFLSGCGLSLSPQEKPQLFQNEKFQATQETARNEDLKECIELGEANVDLKSPTLEIIRMGFIGALVGAGTGAISGSILEDTSNNVAAGSAVGAVVGILQACLDLQKHSPYFERFVEYCLQKKGYEVTGWK